MQRTDCIRRTSTSAMRFAMNLTVRKTLFALTAGFCILIGIIVNGEASTDDDAKSQKPPTAVAVADYASGAISGRVMNRDGAPIPDAEVEIQLFIAGDPMSPALQDLLKLDIFRRALPATTDENGEFVFRDLPSGVMAKLNLHAPGYANEERFGVPVGVKGLEIRLKREGRIEGRLSYADTGAPVTDATVTASAMDMFNARGEARVDENGLFAVTNLSPGLYNLHLGAAPEGWAALPKLRILVTEGQTVSNVDLNLIRCGLITGRVTDADTGEPIANHEVYLRDDAHPESLGSRYSANTDDSGAYKLHAAPGQAAVSSSAPRDYEDIGVVSRSVDVVENETFSVDFQFSKGIEVVVRTLTEDGEPVAGAQIAEEWVAGLPSHRRTDEKGEYIYRGLRPGQRLFLEARHVERGLRGAADVEVQPGKAVEIRMERYEQVEVSGRVVDQNGEPIPAVTIDAVQWQNRRGVSVGIRSAVTDNDGRYRGIMLTVGEEYRISAIPYDGEYTAATDTFTATKDMGQIADIVLQSGRPRGAAWERRSQVREGRMYPEKAEIRLKASLGEPAPELKVAEWLSGRSVSIRDLRGKTIALYFWDLGGSDNLLCIEVMNYLQKAYRKKGLVCVAVCPAAADIEVIKRLVAEKPIIYPVALDRQTRVIGARGETFDRYAVGWGDPVILIDRKGKIANIAYPLNLQDRIQALLAD